MKRLESDVVSASEIADWAWCPEAWRLSSLGHESVNRAALSQGERGHRSKAGFERLSRVVIRLGWGFIAAAVLLALAALLLATG